MALTNLNNLPAPLVAACEDHHVSSGSNLSLTSVYAPAKQVALQKKHRGEMTEDATQRIWSVLGQAVHVILERAVYERNPERRRIIEAIERLEEIENDLRWAYLDENEDPIELSLEDEVIAESLNSARRILTQRLDAYPSDPEPSLIFAEEAWEREVLGWRVRGRIDHLTLEPGIRTLTDYKVTSVWSVKGETKEEWVKQVNLQCLFAPDHIREQIEKLQVGAILRDWRKNERLRHDDYPNEQVVVVPIPMWPLAKTAAYLEERVAIHQQAQLGNMPDCTPEERWEKPTIFAVHKKGNKGATRLYDTVEAAEKHVASQPGLELKVRPGESPRCAQYCSALPFCPQGQRLVAATAAA